MYNYSATSHPLHLFNFFVRLFENVASWIQITSRIILGKVLFHWRLHFATIHVHATNKVAIFRKVRLRAIRIHKLHSIIGCKTLRIDHTTASSALTADCRSVNHLLRSGCPSIGCRSKRTLRSVNPLIIVRDIVRIEGHYFLARPLFSSSKNSFICRFTSSLFGFRFCTLFAFLRFLGNLSQKRTCWLILLHFLSKSFFSLRFEPVNLDIELLFANSRRFNFLLIFAGS